MTNSELSNQEIRQKRIEENNKVSKPIIVELSGIGFDVESISDLYNNHLFYISAIPLLLRWLPIIENHDVKEEIIRALSVPWAKGTNAQNLLVDEFRKSSLDPLYQWAVGNGLSIIADQDILNDIIEMIQNKSYGKSREMLVLALGNIESPEAEQLLLELLNDEDLVGYSVMALGMLKSKKAYPMIEKLTSHPKPWIRKEAKKAAKRIENRNKYMQK
jgi:HEAT repeat protein